MKARGYPIPGSGSKKILLWWVVLRQITKMMILKIDSLYSETCLERPPLENHPVWKDHFAPSEGIILPLESMQIEHVQKDYLSWKTTFSWHQGELGLSLQTGFIVLQTTSRGGLPFVHDFLHSQSLLHPAVTHFKHVVFGEIGCSEYSLS